MIHTVNREQWKRTMILLRNIKGLKVNSKKIRRSGCTSPVAIRWSIDEKLDEGVVWVTRGRLPVSRILGDVTPDELKMLVNLSAYSRLNRRSTDDIPPDKIYKWVMAAIRWEKVQYCTQYSGNAVVACCQKLYEAEL